jgi:hypothetical protein
LRLPGKGWQAARVPACEKTVKDDFEEKFSQEARKRFAANPHRTLRNLESAGLIATRVTKSKAIAAEYSLTQLGTTLIAPLRGMCRWAKRYRRHVKADARLREAETA